MATTQSTFTVTPLPSIDPRLFTSVVTRLDIFRQRLARFWPFPASIPYVLVSDQESGAAERSDPPAYNVSNLRGSLFMPVPYKDSRLCQWHFRNGSGDDDEATAPGPASVGNLDGTFFVAIPTTPAMAPKYPLGSFVIFRDAIELEPVSGDYVYVSMSSRQATPTRRWWQLWRSRPSDTAKGFKYSLCIRQYIVEEDGGVIFHALNGDSYVAGIHQGTERRMRILGIASGHLPNGYHISLVTC